MFFITSGNNLKQHICVTLCVHFIDDDGMFVNIHRNKDFMHFCCKHDILNEMFVLDEGRNCKDKSEHMKHTMIT